MLELPGRRFSRVFLESFAKAKILGVRTGNEHRHTCVWVVVVEDRVFVRSWNDKPTGCLRAFADQREGSVRLNDKEIAVHVRRTRSVRLRIGVLGFAQPERAINTLELVPA